jgi:hypothetical protein
VFIKTLVASGLALTMASLPFAYANNAPARPAPTAEKAKQAPVKPVPIKKAY